MSVIPALLLFVQITGGLFSYTAQPGDSLNSVGARFGVEVRILAESNGLKTTDRLAPDQTLVIDNRHVATKAEGASIVVNVPQRMLFYFENDLLIASYPIAAGQPGWKTPLGEFEIIAMEENPTWDVPASIQEEMRQAGKPVLKHVPPSPQNPLGKYWIGLSLPGIGLHGTNVPGSIYKLATHGCIRLHPEDIEELFTNVDIGTRGRVVYEPVLVARYGDAVYLEVHPDAYKKVPDLWATAVGKARAAGLLDVIDFAAVQEIIRKHDGIARDVTRRYPANSWRHR